MNPIRITARLGGPISLPNGPLHIDALLAWVVAQERQLPPPGFGPLIPIEIPIAREPGGRFHLCSASICDFDAHEMRYVNRKFPLAEAQKFGNDKLRRIHVVAGAQKSYRVPNTVSHVERDEIDWFAIGDAAEALRLLRCVSHLGKRRGVGRGQVREWLVEPFEPWGAGFPVVRDGRPLRPLPPDWPGLVDPMLSRCSPTYPYWDKSTETVCAVPG